MPRRKKVTLAMLAEHLELSSYTVSKALRGLPGMSEETRLEVIKAARELGYLTFDQEHSLIYEGIPTLSLKQRRFLFIMSSNIFTSSYIHVLLQELKKRVAELGHKVDLVLIPDSLAEEEFQSWMEHEGIAYADGLFITMLLPEPLEKLLLDLKLPRILLNFPPAGAKVDSVIWDVYDATRQSVLYLMENGHKRICYFGDREKTRGYRLRWQAFRDTLELAGETATADEHLLQMPENQKHWVDTFKQHMERVRPTALLCATVMDLPWIMYACSECGYAIPQDVSLVRLDHVKDSFIPEITHPVLLMKETGYRAADRMLWRIANPHLPYEHIRLQGPFFAGETVKKLV